MKVITIARDYSTPRMKIYMSMTFWTNRHVILIPLKHPAGDQNFRIYVTLRFNRPVGDCHVRHQPKPFQYKESVTELLEIQRENPMDSNIKSYGFKYQILWIQISNPMDSNIKSYGFKYQILWIQISNPMDSNIKSYGFKYQILWIQISNPMDSNIKSYGFK